MYCVHLALSSTMFLCRGFYAPYRHFWENAQPTWRQREGSNSESLSQAEGWRLFVQLPWKPLWCRTGSFPPFSMAAHPQNSRLNSTGTRTARTFLQTLSRWMWPADSYLRVFNLTHCRNFKMTSEMVHESLERTSEVLHKVNISKWMSEMVHRSLKRTPRMLHKVERKCTSEMLQNFESLKKISETLNMVETSSWTVGRIHTFHCVDDELSLEHTNCLQSTHLLTRC